MCKHAQSCYFSPTATKWKVVLRLMRNDVSYDTKHHYENMGDAMKDLHRLLNSPPPEGARVGAGAARARDADPPNIGGDWYGTGQPVPYKDPHWGRE